MEGNGRICERISSADGVGADAAALPFPAATRAGCIPPRTGESPRSGRSAPGARSTSSRLAHRAATAALIIWSHTNYGKGFVTFVAVLVAGQLLERSRFPCR